MKLIILLFCGVSIFCDYAYGRIDLTEDGIVGVSQEKLKDYMTKAIKGFRKVILEGDDELDYPIMDPYKVEDLSFDQVDASGKNKYKLDFLNKKEVIIKGFSDYTPTDVEASAKDMRLSFGITFNNLETEIPYKLDGQLFKNFMPVYGEGIVNFSTKNQGLFFAVDLTIEQGFIVVEKVKSNRDLNNIEVNVTGLMDLSDPFATIVIDDVLDSWVKQHGQKILDKYVQDVVEEAVGGMTVEEFFDYLDHFVKKYDQQ